MAPTQVDRFEIIGEIATYPAGAIYKATDPEFHRTIALRTYQLDAQGPAAESLLQRARAEAASAVALNSGNIVALYESGEADGVFYVAVEFVDGIKLEARIARRELSIGELIDYSRQVCSAFDHAATHGIFHRNLRPANIIEEWDGTVKIMDFGIAKSGYRVTQPGGVPDALYYMSPEQLRGAKLDVRSSVFSWAAILYYIITGRRPFEGGSVDEVRRAILDSAPIAASEVAPQLSPGLNQAVMKALSKAAAGRFSSGREFVTELENHHRFGQAEQASVPAARLDPEFRPALVIPITTKAAVAPVPYPAAAPNPAFAAARAPASAQDGGGWNVNATAPAWARTTAQPSSTAPPTIPPVAAAPVNSDARTGSPPPSRAPAQRPASKHSDALLQLLTSRTVVYSTALVLLVLIAAVAGIAYIRHKSEIIIAPVAPPAESLPPPQPTAATPAAAADVAAPPAKEQDHAGDEDEVVWRPARRSGGTPAGSRTSATGTLIVTSTPERAQVQIDGRRDPAWVTPYTAADLTPGEHTVTVAKPGFQTQSRVVEVYGAMRASLAFALPELQAAVALASEPAGAAVFVDGRDSGKRTPAQLTLSKGSHSFTLKKAGYLDEVVGAQLVAGQTLRLSPKLKLMGDVGDVRTAGKFKKLFGGGGIPKDMGALEIKSSPKGATILLNNRVMEKTTPAEFYLPPGAYQLVIKASGYQPVQKIVHVPEGNKVTVDQALTR